MSRRARTSKSSGRAWRSRSRAATTSASLSEAVVVEGRLVAQRHQLVGTSDLSTTNISRVLRMPSSVRRRIRMRGKRSRQFGAAGAHRYDAEEPVGVVDRETGRPANRLGSCRRSTSSRCRAHPGRAPRGGPFLDAVRGAVGDDGLPVADRVDRDAAPVAAQFGEVEPPFAAAVTPGAGAVQEQDRGGALTEVVVVRERRRRRSRATCPRARRRRRSCSRGSGRTGNLLQLASDGWAVTDAGRPVNDIAARMASRVAGACWARQAPATNRSGRSEDDRGGPVVEPLLHCAGVITEDDDVVVHVLLGPLALGLRNDRDQSGTQHGELVERFLRQQNRAGLLPHTSTDHQLPIASSSRTSVAARWSPVAGGNCTPTGTRCCWRFGPGPVCWSGGRSRPDACVVGSASTPRV